MKYYVILNLSNSGDTGTWTSTQHDAQDDAMTSNEAKFKAKSTVQSHVLRMLYLFEHQFTVTSNYQQMQNIKQHGPRKRAKQHLGRTITHVHVYTYIHI